MCFVDTEYPYVRHDTVDLDRKEKMLIMALPMAFDGGVIYNVKLIYPSRGHTLACQLTKIGRSAPMRQTRIDGFTHDRFTAAREAFEANFANGEELGASFCATVEGETVVDLWGGYAEIGRAHV